MKLLSPAKVNLGLRIVGRRSDGYHLLESLFWPIDLADEITIEKASKISVSIEWAEDAPVPSLLPQKDTDSVFKMLKSHPELGNWSIKIKKRIPIGAGLGGSSSNAGTVLRFLKSNNSPQIALSTGADVPFFLDPVPTWVSGIGEKRTPIQLSAGNTDLVFHLILLNEACITKEVFSSFKASGAAFSDPTELPKVWNQATLRDFLSKTKNDLERPAIAQVPKIAKVLDFLKGFDFPYAGLSGSGSTCFAVSSSDADSETISKDLRHFCRKYTCSYIEANTFGA